MTDPIIIRGIGGKVAPVACLTSTKLTFTGGGSNGNRSCVVIQAYGAPVYLKVVRANGADPVPSSTDYHYPIPAATSFPIALGPGVDIYAQSAGNVSGFEGL